MLMGTTRRRGGEKWQMIWRNGKDTRLSHCNRPRQISNYFPAVRLRDATLPRQASHQPTPLYASKPKYLLEVTTVL